MQSFSAFYDHCSGYDNADFRIKAEELFERATTMMARAGCSNDYTEVVSLLCQASRLDYGPACYALYKCYTKGLGVVASAVIAHSYLKKAVEQGHFCEEASMIQSCNSKIRQAQDLLHSGSDTDNIESALDLYHQACDIDLFGGAPELANAYGKYICQLLQQGASAKLELLLVEFHCKISYYKQEDRNYLSALFYMVTAEMCDKSDFAQKEFISLRFYSRAARFGSKEAYLKLANCYLYGKGTRKSLEKALNCFSYYDRNYDLTSIANNSRRMTAKRIGSMSRESALACMQEMLKINVADEYCKEGSNHLTRDGRRNNLARAMECYRKSLESAVSPYLLCWISDCAAWSSPLIKSKHQWISEIPSYLERATYGDNFALGMLGHCYEYGHGVEADKVVASDYYSKAAAGGNYYAEIRLRFLNGEITGKHDCDEMRLIEKSMLAALQGDAEAQNYLASHYIRGALALEQNIARGVSLLKESAKQGYKRAQVNLGMAFLLGLVADFTAEMAVECLQGAARQGSNTARMILPEAFFKMASGCKKAADSPNSHATACEYFRKAAELGHEYAMLELGDYLECGLDVEQDLEQALHWYTKAAEMGNQDAREKLRKLGGSLAAK